MILAGLAVGTQRAYAVQWRLTVVNVESGFCSELRCRHGVDDRLELAVGGPEVSFLRESRQSASVEG
jgi:hypothetical protein